MKKKRAKKPTVSIQVDQDFTVEELLWNISNGMGFETNESAFCLDLIKGLSEHLDSDATEKLIHFLAKDLGGRFVHDEDFQKLKDAAKKKKGG